MAEQASRSTDAAALDVALDRDLFLRTLVRELARTLEDVVGLEHAQGFFSAVGQRLGDQIDRQYRAALGVASLTRQQVADVLVDLKRRIQADFYVVEQNDDRLVLGSRSCPFGEKVLERKSVCMMTSSVFGSIAAENLGYARVELQRAIADGCAECRVVVHLRMGSQADDAEGREYFRSSDGGTV